MMFLSELYSEKVEASLQMQHYVHHSVSNPSNPCIYMNYVQSILIYKCAMLLQAMVDTINNEAIAT